jgi:subtilisin family serine protease
MPVVTGSGTELSANQVRDAIVKAAHTKGWAVQDGSNGRLVATVYVRTHMAEVEIDYSPEAYSISYRNSDNLLYNGSNIHRNYNKWIQLLEIRINEELRGL